MIFPGFCGPTYESRSVIAEGERCINLYPEFIESEQGKNNTVLYATPGLAAFYDFGSGPVRGFSTGATYFYAVIGTRFLKISNAGTLITNIGAVATDADNSAVQIVGNGTTGELFIVSGGVAYLYNEGTTVFGAIAALAAVVCRGACFLNGYFITAEVGTGQFFISGLYDGTTWDALDFATAEAYGDNIVMPFALHGQLWLFGDLTVEPYYNSGDSDFPFRPIAGALIESGCRAPHSVTKVGDNVFWLGVDRNGHAYVNKANGFVPERVSTHSIERFLQAATRLDDAIGWTYEEEKHRFYCLYVPALSYTYVYDLATNLWHERASWSGSAFTAHLGRCHEFIAGLHLVGSRVDGKIYKQLLDYNDDAGAEIKRIRRCPHLNSEMKRQFHSRFYLDMEVGNSADVTLSYSNDGGKTFSTPVTRNSGATTKSRVYWNRLGSARDRVYEVATVSKTKIALINAYLEATAGAH